jgi:single-stranded-DNA-specific exonuclease
VGLDLAEELELLRPFGMGNPGVNLLVPAAKVSDVRPMGEGRHARFMVGSAGVRARVVAFGVGGGLSVKPGEERRHDLVARLEANEWQGAVEPRLVLRSLHPIDAANAEGRVEAQRNGDCAQAGPRGCAACSCRARGRAWWEAALLELDRDLEELAASPLPPHSYGGARDFGGGSRTVVDRRGHGILGSIGDLLSTGESVLVVCADVSRRRYLLERELDPVRFDCPPGAVLSARCAPRALPEPSAGGLFLVDYATMASSPRLPGGFAHVFALDPPPSRWLDSLLASGAAPDGGAFYHLGWGSPEVELTRRVLEHEYGLRGPLAAVYRALARHPDGAADDALEALLAGDGRHPRTPAAAGRCLRVLVELGLAEVVRSSATVRCTIIDNRRVDLERSKAFVAYDRVYQEGLRFLSEQAQPGRELAAA